MLFYIRSQKTCSFQKELSAFLDSHGTSRSGLNSGPVLGYGTSPRTTDRHKKTIQENCKQMTQMKVKEAIQVCNLEIVKKVRKQVDTIPFVSDK